MKKIVAVFFAIGLIIGLQAHAQLITYSEPDRDDARDISFEIMGKMNGIFHVFKNYRDQNFICLFDNEMNQIEKVKLEFLPDRIFNADFLQYPSFYYMFFQYQKRNIVYCMAVKLDAKAQKIGEPIQLDTTEVNYSASNKIYTVLNSEDKQALMVLKVNNKNDKIHYLTTSLFNKDLMLIKKTTNAIAMPERNDVLKEFQLDNDGDLVFIKTSGTIQNDNINKVILLQKAATNDSIQQTDLRIKSLYLDDIRVKVDNVNKHYLVTSFGSKQRRGNIECLYCFLYDKTARKELLNTSITFSDELRSEAKSDGSTKMAFNDYFLHNIIMRKDGGFIISAESVYTSSRGSGPYTRWDNFGSPNNGFINNYYYNNSAFNVYNYPWNRFGYNNNIVRYYAENIAVLSVDPTGKMDWSNVIRKSQYDDNTDHFIGYGIVNTGGEIHFLFNSQEKRQMLLTDQSINPEGQVTRAPTLKNLDKGYDFMPRQAKQTGSKQIIMPCQYRNYICFAKIDM
jgi:hypothetical protein